MGYGLWAGCTPDSLRGGHVYMPGGKMVAPAHASRQHGYEREDIVP